MPFGGQPPCLAHIRRSQQIGGRPGLDPLTQYAGGSEHWCGDAIRWDAGGRQHRRHGIGQATGREQMQLVRRPRRRAERQQGQNARRDADHASAARARRRMKQSPATATDSSAKLAGSGTFVPSNTIRLYRFDT